MFGTSTCNIYMVFLQRHAENIVSILNNIKFNLNIFVGN